MSSREVFGVQAADSAVGADQVFEKHHCGLGGVRRASWGLGFPGHGVDLRRGSGQRQQLSHLDLRAAIARRILRRSPRTTPRCPDRSGREGPKNQCGFQQNVPRTRTCRAFQANRQSAAWPQTPSDEFTVLWTRILDQTCGVNSLPLNDA